MKKSGTPLYFLAAMTWFGYHCGAGFASGAQVRIYAAKYGSAGIIVPLIAWIACSIFMYIVCEYGRLIKAKSYRDVGASIYWDNPVIGKIAVVLWDILIFMSSVTAVGSCVAGCGTLLQQLGILSYPAGCGLFIITMVGLLCFGKNILERLGKLGVTLVIAFFTVCAIGLFVGFDHMIEVMTTDLGTSAIAGASSKMLVNAGMTYGIVQIGSFQALCVMSGKFEHHSDAVKFVLLGFTINCGAMVLSYLSQMAYYPGIIDAPLPTLSIIQNFQGIPGILLSITYNFVLIMAYITTAGAMIAGGQARYLPLCHQKIQNELLCRILITLIFIGSATALSTLGLDGILTTVNGINAAVRRPIWFYPLLVLGPAAIYRAKKNLAQKQP